ncbi:MAG: modulated transcriptional regulator, MtlR family [Caloramator sp.]|jgi:transcriptional antiterminator/mannitol/fructose-specific phosphotransferase system IIA component (Ntr-type)|uniref:BglG family transcription antiterminator n=1 Tax=Caloramator sp. TaxID=1871330 RepID=UPI001DD9AFA3|nr:BglG family transcription antiterminator [Caloramator sp.]MBZ4663589.1 modulated transcriptional regulator, MtlR family [Caloramator sp.]
MVSITDRCKAIISYLLNQEDAVTIDNIAEHFNISPRTTRYDLDLIEEWLLQNEIKLIRKSRKGVWIENKDRAKLILQKYIDEKLYIKNFFLSSDERKKMILNILFRQKEPITIGELADKLLVSKSTIIKDLTDIEKWLNEKKISIVRKPNSGIKISASEADFRRALLDYLYVNFDKNTLLDFLLLNKKEKISKFQFLVDYQIKEIFNEIEPLEIENIICQIEKRLDIKFVDTDFAGLLIHFTIALKRLKAGEKIEMPEEQLKKLKETNEFKIIKTVLKEFEKIYSIEIPDSEIGYITIHVLGARFRENFIVNNNILKNDEVELENKINEFIKIISYRTGLNLCDDSELIRGLFIHIKPAIERMKYGLKSKNPFVDEIKSNYYEIFQICKQELNIFETYYNISFDEDEISYITMHVASSIERNNKPKKIDNLKVIVVCSSGIGTAQMLSSRINKEFGFIDIVEQCSVMELNEEKLKNVDFIVSTIPINFKVNRPVIQVSPLLNPNDIIKIKGSLNYVTSISKDIEHQISKIINIIEKNCIINNRYNLIKDLENFFNKNEDIVSHKQKNGVLDYLNNDLIMCNVDAIDFSDAIFKVALPLINKNFVKPRYIEKLIELSKLVPSNFYLGQGFAMPHTKSEGDVLKTCMSLGILKNPVMLGNNKIDVILILGVNDSVLYKQAIEDIVNLLQIDDFNYMIRKCVNPDEVINLILNSLNKFYISKGGE